MSSVREQQHSVSPHVFRCPGEMTVTSQTGGQVTCDRMKSGECATTSSSMYTSKTDDSWNFMSALTHQDSYRGSYLFDELTHGDSSTLLAVSTCFDKTQTSLSIATLPSTSSMFATDGTHLGQDTKANLFCSDVTSSQQCAQSYAEFSPPCQTFSSNTGNIEVHCNQLKTPQGLIPCDIYKGTSSTNSLPSQKMPESCLLENPFSGSIQQGDSQQKSCNQRWNFDDSAQDSVCTGTNRPEYLMSSDVKGQDKDGENEGFAVERSEDPSSVLVIRCQVCTDSAAGFHCGAYVCEACKKFFIRTAKKANKLMCSKSKQCLVTKKLRTLCQYCRYQKCLQLGMYKPGEGPGQGSQRQSNLPCRVCSAPSSGYHFGAITCEGCKGFFRRMTKERDVTRFSCQKGGNCPVTQSTRNVCKACRYQKCFGVGMSADGSRIGRQPNAVKHATLLEMQSRREMKSGNSPESFPFVQGSCSHCPTSECSSKVSATNNVTRGMTKHGSSHRTEAYRCIPNTGISQSMNCLHNDKGSNTMCRVTNHSNQEKVSKTSSVKGSEVNKDIVSQVMAAGQELSFMTVRPADDVELTQEDFRNLPSRWKDMLERFTYFTHGALKFAKKIPGFRTLKLDDQASLLQTAAYPIVILSLSKCYNQATRQFNYFNYSEKERLLIFHYIPGFRPLKEHFISTGEMVTMLKLDDIEQHFLAALILLSPDEGNVIEKHRVWEVQENIAAALQEYEEKTYEDGGTRFGVLITRLAEFRLINLQHQQVVSAIIRQNPSFQVPQLFSEMFLSS